MVSQLSKVAFQLHQLLTSYPYKEPERQKALYQVQEACIEEIDKASVLNDEHLGRDDLRVDHEPLDKLCADFTELFCGVGAPLAPLWGSAYLSRHNLLNADSTQELYDFYSRHHIKMTTGDSEPIDNLGHIFFALSHFASVNGATCKGTEPYLFVREFIVQHIEPWSLRCADLISENASTEFYRSVGVLVRSFLTLLFDAYEVKPSNIRIYL